jgi:hypothetical protein
VLHSTKLRVDGVEVNVSHVIAMRNATSSAMATRDYLPPGYEADVHGQSTTAAAGHTVYFVTGRRSITDM